MSDRGLRSSDFQILNVYRLLADDENFGYE